MHRFVVFVCGLMLSATAAFAQLPTATILGQTQDASGAVVPGAQVTLRNTDTGQVRATPSSQDGSFRFDALPVGNYELHVEKEGFKTEVRTGLTLTVAQQAVVNITLEVGQSTQSVTVTGEAPLINTTTASVGSLVDEQKIEDLPLNGRNYNNLTLLQPGVSQNRNTQSLGLVYSSNGAPVRSNTFLLDGANLVNLGGAVSGSGSYSVTGSTLGVDGILEYRIITNSFEAEYGQTMGSQMILVSRGGTNQFHGDAFDFLRNSALDARNFFDAPPSLLGSRIPEFRRNQFGGAVGGPIRKDKTFFYGVYEALRATTGTTNRDVTIDPGCHGPANAVVWNGTGTQPAGSVGPCTALGANPSGAGTNSVTIAPQMAPFLAQYPLPNLPGDQYVFPFAQPTREDYGQMRVDQTFTSKDSAFVRYTIDDAAQTSPLGYPQFSSVLNGRDQYLTLAENHIFSPALLNSARFSFSRTTPTIITPSTISGAQYSVLEGFPGISIYPQLLIGGVSSIGSSQIKQVEKQNLFTWSDDLYYTHGKHSLKFGVLVNHYQIFTLNNAFSSGQIQFANVGTFLTAHPVSLSGLAPNFVAGRHWFFDSMGFYAQDEYRVTPRLTLNLGLRYEPMTTLTEGNDLAGNIINVCCDALATVGKPFLNPSMRNLGPRAGFAYDVRGNGKTAIRGGFAMLYDQFTYGTALVNLSQGFAPFNVRFNVNSPPAFTLTVPFPVPSTITPNFNGPTYYMKQPYALDYNVTVEQQLPFQMALTLTYVGTRGIHLIHPEDNNPALPDGIPQNGSCVARPAGQAINLASMVYGDATACWLPGTPRINPNWASMTQVGPYGDSWYNGLQFGVNKQTTKGLEFQSSFTWSKLIDTGQGGGGSDNLSYANPVNSVDPFHASTDRGLGDFNAALNWRFNAIYKFPTLARGHAFVGEIVNGWWASGILSLDSGFPFNPLLSSNRSLDLSNLGGAILADRPDLNPGRNNSNITHGTSTGCLGVPAGTPLGTPTLYFDPCAYTLQPPGFLGNSPRNNLIGPGFANLDFSLVKDTALPKLGENGNLEFRAEFFNITNHPNFLVPSAQVFAGTVTDTVESPLAAAGKITATSSTSRQIQFGLKLVF